MRKLFSIVLTLFSLTGFAQIPPGYVLYDTVINYTGAGAGTQQWNVAILRSRDTTSRILLLNMNGAGQVGSSTAHLTEEGFFYWIQNGWDGGILLGNGIYRPNLVTIQPAATNVRPYNTVPLILALRAWLHPKGIGIIGFSMGSQCLGWALQYHSAPGIDNLMPFINCYVDMQGEAPSSYGTGFTSTYPNDLGHWAKAYGGKFFGAEGTADTRKVYQISQNMNDSVSGSAYFTYENYGGGGHGSVVNSIDFWNYCYNAIQSTAQLNWTNQTPFGNQYVVSLGGAANTLGTYVYSATTGTSVLQWMLRQMDTTISSIPYIRYDSVAAGEYVSGRIDHFGNAWAYTSNTDLSGSNGAGIPGGGIPCLMPTGMKFKTVTNTLHGLVFVSVDGHAYAFGGTDQGQCGTGDLSSTTIKTPKLITVDSSGKDSINNVTLVQGTYAGNAAQGLYLVKYAAAADTLFMTGDTRFGMRGDGTLGDTTSRPVKVWSLPAGKHFVQLDAEKYGIALLNDGTVWTTGGSNSVGVAPNYATLGYSPTTSATDYLLWHQVNGFDDSVRQITGGDVGGTLALTKTGKLYGWGLHSDYMGNEGGAAYTTPHDLTDSISSFISGGIASITGNSQTFHIISKTGLLYGWGDNACGSIGDGNEIYFPTWSTPYFFNPAQRNGLQYIHPVQVSKRSDWKRAYGSKLFGFTLFATNMKDSLFFAGRNKGGVAGNGVIECLAANGSQAAAFPNSWDVPQLTLLNPPAITASIPVVSPVYYTTSITTPANACTKPSRSSISRAGTDLSLGSGVTAATLDGSGSTSTGFIIYQVWTQVSGPNTALIDLPSAIKPNLTGLITGTYIFQYKISSDGLDSSFDQVAVTIAGTSSLPIANAGHNQTITLPTTSVFLDGTGSAAISPATITNYLWTKVSGPGATSIANNTNSVATATGLQQGSYVFNLHITDSNGNIADDQVQVSVNAAGTLFNYLSIPKRVNIN